MILISLAWIHVQKWCLTLMEKATTWVSDGGHQEIQRKYHRIPTEIRIFDGIPTENVSVGNSENFVGIPSEI